MRTPLRAQVGDDLLLKAKNLVVLQSAQTPLIGGVNEELVSLPSSSRSFATPNPLATPLITADALNDQDKRANARKKLKFAFSSIPAPKNEYELLPPELPTISEDNEFKEASFEMDAEEKARLDALQKAAAEANLKALQSSVVQRGNFPVPSFTLSYIDPLAFGKHRVSEEITNAHAMINNECLRLMINDIVQEGTIEAPDDWDEIVKEFKIDELSLSEIEKAKSLIAEESLLDSKSLFEDLVNHISSRDQQLTSIFEPNMLTNMQKLNSKLYNKIRIKHGGYIARIDTLQKECYTNEIDLESLKIDLKCFEQLQENESRAIVKRLEEWTRLSTQVANKQHFFL
jgi:pre-mRNA-splicing factor CDC5/CEF1